MSGHQLNLQSGALDVWAEHWSIELVHQQPTIGRLSFDDTDAWHTPLIDALMARERDPKVAEPKAGGHRRLDDFNDWGVPEAELICLRAVKMCRALMNTQAINLHTANALIVRDGQAVPATEPEEHVATLTYVLAGAAPLQFRHHRLEAAYVVPAAEALPGKLYACPGSMVMSLPYLHKGTPALLLQFGFVRAAA
ncbi:hypothetical protein GYB61_08315 [bacterium]|nr:hypothetical protein [bacterium]